MIFVGSVQSFCTFVEAGLGGARPPRGDRKFLRGRSCRFARFREAVHVQVPPFAPLCAGHMAEACRGQHSRRLTIRERARRSRSSSHFAQQPLQQVVRSQTPPVLALKRLVVRRLFDPGQHQRRRVGQFHLLQFRRNLLGLLPRGGAIFLSVNGLQHRRHFFHFAGRGRGLHVAIIAHRTPLPLRFRIKLPEALHQSQTEFNYEPEGWGFESLRGTHIGE